MWTERKLIQRTFKFEEHQQKIDFLLAVRELEIKKIVINNNQHINKCSITVESHEDAALIDKLIPS